MSLKMEDRIRQKIEEKYGKENYKLKNDSALHNGHAGDDGSGQTHFQLKIISAHFENMGKVAAQREIYSLLADEFKDGLHALALKINPKEL